jgi:pimeloyl-ACP methyl ester carboxylesterase
MIVTKKLNVKTAMLTGATAVASIALANFLVARRTERKHPPKGTFVEVEGVRLHYSDRGQGSAVVLIHGSAVTGEDWNTSGVAELLLRANHRVIIFDRPGCGYSERPQGRLWTAAQQADLLHQAIAKLEIEQPVVVGHSWGAIVALAMAQRHPADVAGLVVVSGYYFWTLRPDVVMVTPNALPLLGDLLSYTISPLLGWLQMPLVKRAMFSPADVPSRFEAEYPTALVLRPSQIRTTALDGALMIPGALSLKDHYKDMDLPVAIIAGDGDKIVFPRAAEQLRDCIEGSTLTIVEGAGHMVHHLAPEKVAEAITNIADLAQKSGGHGATQLAHH